MRKIASFSDVIENLANGQTADECMRVFRQVVQSVARNGGKGRMTLKIDVFIDGMNAVVLTDKITSVLPDPKRDATSMGIGKEWFIGDGVQESMDVDGGASVVKIGDFRMDAQTGEVLEEARG